MPTRVLDWNGLLGAARPPAGSVISVAGIPARVKRRLTNDVGVIVYGLDEEAGPDESWSLRKGQDLILLRALVDAGAVTIDDPDAPFECFITGCPSVEVSPRGHVHTIDGRLHVPCDAHWTAIMTVIGALDVERAETAAAGDALGLGLDA